jgi:hypothetical protein
MKLGPFVRCFEYHGINTGISGSIVGAYDFSSGSGQSLIYNILYPSGQHFSGAGFYGPVLPLINVGRTGANGYLSGVSAYRIGYEVSGDFGLLLDLSYDNCNRSGITTPNVIFSTTSGLATGLRDSFFVGIDGANQLFFSTSGFSKTLYHELKARSLAFVNYGNLTTVEFGIFDPFENSVVSEIVTLPYELKSINSLYLGGLLTYQATGVGGLTGFSGRIYNSILFQKPIGFLEASGCLECMFAIGSGTGARPVTTVSVPSITGYLFSGVSQPYITGYVPITGQVVTSNNSIINVLFPSGQTGVRIGEEVATVLTGMTVVRITGDPVWIFPKSVDYNSFVSYDIQFRVSLSSGDVVEIYTYSGFNTNVNHDVEDELFPKSTSFVQIIGNGLVETFGVDYGVQNNNVISGFFEDDSLRYDTLTGGSIITGFSGYWSRAKVPLTGGGYFPPSAQFDETTVSGRILITGVTGSYIPANSDVYLNGQKLASGVHYIYADASVSGWYGSVTGLNVVVLNPSFLPDFTGEFAYSPTGGPATGIISIEDSELAFLPNYGVFTRYYSELIGSLTIYSGVTGFSEQVWVNGVRQRPEADYIRNMPCLLTSGDVSEPTVPFNFYKNDTGYFNIN